jgi:hypothetical protein
MIFVRWRENPAMEESTAACQKCASTISTEATRCPECGYEPSAQGARARWWLIFLGALLTMTVVGAVIGIPMIVLGWLGNRATAGRKPTTHAP